VQGMPLFDPRVISGKFPLFNDQADITDTGYIVCSTCHNPHQWDPAAASRGPGKEVKGNIKNCFLRPNLDTKFCMICHGKESLLKFNYFHTQISRKKKGKGPATSSKEGAPVK
ncbi:MAG: hypothetical protein WCQ99_10990, partial [Pseudomonadota bacterium]